MRHLILTGFMGVGKTTIGKLLASHLNRPFVDLDDFFQIQTGLKPKAYIPRFGEKAFRKLEKVFLRKVLLGGPVVLATGGGVVLDPQNRRWMLARGFVVWLKTPLKLLLIRLRNSNPRPLLPHPFSFENLKKMYQARLPFYQQCHFSIVNNNRQIKVVATMVLHQYRRFLGLGSVVPGPWSVSYASRTFGEFDLPSLL